MKRAQRSAGAGYHNCERMNKRSACAAMRHVVQRTCVAWLEGLEPRVMLSSSWHAIGDRVWLDSNSNGVQDTGEAGIPGVTS